MVGTLEVRERGEPAMADAKWVDDEVLWMHIYVSYVRIASSHTEPLRHAMAHPPCDYS